MCDKWIDYDADPRTQCKYGAKCYQKNADHHKRFKHPSKKDKIAVSDDYSGKGDSDDPIPKDPTLKRNRESPKGHNKRPKVSHESKKELNPDDVIKTNDKKATPINPSTSDNQYQSTELVSLNDIKQFHNFKDKSQFKQLFLVDMPEDFFEFYNFLKSEFDNIENAIHSVNLELIGPYELLLGCLPVLDKKELYLVHWRFFYDPPEFQAVLKTKGSSQYHVGYFRDSPEEPPCFLACNDPQKDYVIKPMAENIFGAVYTFLQAEVKKSPFTAMACRKFIDKLKKWSERHNYTLEAYNMKNRLGKIVTRTFHNAGIIVPYEAKKQLGYRPLVENNATIKKIFMKIETATTEKEKDDALSELQPVITYANIAMDEFDFGTSLELGIDLFCSGLKDLESMALHCLCSAYTLLNRDAFIKIVQAHLQNRRKGPNMSVLGTKK